MTVESGRCAPYHRKEKEQQNENENDFREANCRSAKPC